MSARTIGTRSRRDWTGLDWTGLDCSILVDTSGGGIPFGAIGKVCCSFEALFSGGFGIRFWVYICITFLTPIIIISYHMIDLDIT